MEKLKGIIEGFTPKILEPKKHEKLLFSFVDKVICAYIKSGGRYNKRLSFYDFLELFEVIHVHLFKPDNPNEIDWDKIEQIKELTKQNIKTNIPNDLSVTSYCREYPHGIIENAMIYHYGCGNYDLFNDILKLLENGISFIFGEKQYISHYKKVEFGNSTDLCAALIDSSFGEPKYEVYNLSQRCEILLRISNYLKSENIATYLQLYKYSNAFDLGDKLFQDALKTLMSENIIKKEENGLYSLVS